MANTEDIHDPLMKPRRAWLAMLLSLFSRGLGQVYNGQPLKGLVLFAAPFLLVEFTNYIALYQSPGGLLGEIILVLSIHLYAVVEAGLKARKLNNFKPKIWNKWPVYIILALVTIAFESQFNYQKAMGIQTHTVSTQRHLPTFKPGETFVAELKKSGQKDFHYGDMVLYQHENQSLFSLRVIGQPLDTLHFDKFHHLTQINGQPLGKVECRDTFLNKRRVNCLKTTLPNGFSHKIYRSGSTRLYAKDSAYKIGVPPNTYFLMGDFRDNSLDSRKIGPLHISAIKGKVIYSIRSKLLEEGAISVKRLDSF